MNKTKWTTLLHIFEEWSCLHVKPLLKLVLIYTGNQVTVSMEEETNINSDHWFSGHERCERTLKIHLRPSTPVRRFRKHWWFQSEEKQVSVKVHHRHRVSPAERGIRDVLWDHTHWNWWSFCFCIRLMCLVPSRSCSRASSLLQHRKNCFVCPQRANLETRDLLLSVPDNQSVDFSLGWNSIRTSIKVNRSISVNRRNFPWIKLRDLKMRRVAVLGEKLLLYIFNHL